MQLIIDKKCNKQVDVIISPQIIDIWHKYRQCSTHDKEACGVLIGGFDQQEKRIIVEDCTQPMKGDFRKFFSFLLRDIGHQCAVDKAFAKSRRTSFYLGTWHTHPEKNPTPSKGDLTDWKNCMDRNPLIPSFLFAIVGTEFVFLHPQIADWYA
jgi:integrative and conjugative element protein (TIGR02256 family)